MKTIELSTASKPLSEYAEEIEGGDILLTSHQKPIAVIMQVNGTDRETLSLSTNRDFLDIIDKARSEFKSGKTLSLEEMKRAVLEDG